ncbi:hypothetical protein B0H19DRAFT_1386135 [Mycena capillaripes]|nr:hypothetical protein B0H19DRAFT_1386135 [Mycena capillaripes]
MNSPTLWEAFLLPTLLTTSIEPNGSRTFSIFGIRLQRRTASDPFHPSDLQALIMTFKQSLRQNSQTSPLMSYAKRIHDVLLKILIGFKKNPRTAPLNETGFMVTAVAMSIITSRVITRSHCQPYIPFYANLDNCGPFVTVYSAITNLSESVAQCCNATCTETSESTVQKLRYCSQCGIMRYCSCVCQKAAWKYHKLGCKDLEKLKNDILPRASRSNTKNGGATAQFFQEFEKEALNQGFTVQRMEEIRAEVLPFLHYEDAGITCACLDIRQSRIS